jgi:hypothetical protein
MSLAEKLDKIRSPKLQNQREVGTPEMDYITVPPLNADLG